MVGELLELLRDPASLTLAILSVAVQGPVLHLRLKEVLARPVCGASSDPFRGSGGP